MMRSMSIYEGSIGQKWSDVPVVENLHTVPPEFQFLSGRVAKIPNTACIEPVSVNGVGGLSITFYQEGNLFCQANSAPVPDPQIFEQSADIPRGCKRGRDDDGDDDDCDDCDDDYDDDGNGDEVCYESPFVKRQKVDMEKEDSFASLSELLRKPCEILTCDGSDRGILSLIGLQLKGSLSPHIVSFPEKLSTVEGEKHFDTLMAAFRNYILGAIRDETSPYYKHSLIIHAIIAERKRLAELRKKREENEKKLCEIGSLLSNEKVPEPKSLEKIKRILNTLPDSYSNREVTFVEMQNAIFKSIRISENNRVYKNNKKHEHDPSQQLAQPTNEAIFALATEKMTPCLTDRAMALFDKAVADTM